MKKLLKDQRGLAMTTLLVSILVFIFIAFIGGLFLIAMAPQMETAMSTANITNTTTSTVLGFLPWAIPTLGGIALLVGGIIVIFKGIQEHSG